MTGVMFGMTKQDSGISFFLKSIRLNVCYLTQKSFLQIVDLPVFDYF